MPPSLMCISTNKGNTFHTVMIFSMNIYNVIHEYQCEKPGFNVSHILLSPIIAIGN